MAISLTGKVGPTALHNATTNGTADTWDGLTFPNWARCIAITAGLDGPIRVAFDAAEGGTYGSEHTVLIMPGGTRLFPLTPGRGGPTASLFVCSPETSVAFDIELADNERGVSKVMGEGALHDIAPSAVAGFATATSVGTGGVTQSDWTYCLGSKELRYMLELSSPVSSPTVQATVEWALDDGTIVAQQRSEKVTAGAGALSLYHADEAPSGSINVPLSFPVRGTRGRLKVTTSAGTCNVKATVQRV